MQNDSACPCCSGKDFASCCKELLEEKRFASTPLELMRSRFTAHANKNMPHIIRTMRGKPLKLFDEEKTRDEWFELCDWYKLEILDAPEVSEHDKQGIVEFKAHYKLNGEEHVLHERSKFLKENDRWYYVSGQKKNPIVEQNLKVGRNDPCLCGSGAKYKKCCGSVYAS